jgi:hypothetical protein
VNSGLEQLEAGGHVNRFVDRAIDGAVLFVHPMHALDGVAGIRTCAHSIVHADATQHQDVILDLDIALRVSGERLAGCLNSARLQRAPEGAKQSACCGGYDVIERRRVRVDHVAADSVVHGDRAVRAEAHRLGFRGQIRDSQWTRHPFDVHA